MFLVVQSRCQIETITISDIAVNMTASIMLQFLPVIVMFPFLTVTVIEFASSGPVGASVSGVESAVVSASTAPVSYVLLRKAAAVAFAVHINYSRGAERNIEA